MYGSDNFSNWLLMPSGPDNFLFSSLDIISAKFTNENIWDDKQNVYRLQEFAFKSARYVRKGSAVQLDKPSIYVS